MTYKEEIVLIKGEIVEIKDSVSRIETALSGDPKNGIDGVAQKVCKNSEYIEKDKRLKWMIAGVVSFFSIVGAKILGLFDGKN